MPARGPHPQGHLILLPVLAQNAYGCGFLYPSPLQHPETCLRKHVAGAENKVDSKDTPLFARK